MDDFYAAADHYTYQGSFVLINRLGLMDQRELGRAEKLLVAARLIDVSAVPRTFDYTHFRALHFHMFQDLYGWAGVERDVGVIKGGSRFATPLFIREHACRFLNEFRNMLQENIHSFSALPAIFSHFISEMNVVHAFREGNGRQLREFVREVLEELGCGFSAGTLRRERWIPAVIAGFGGDEHLLTALLEEAIITPATNRGRLFAPIPAGEASRLCASLRRSGCPTDIVAEYRATLHC